MTGFNALEQRAYDLLTSRGVAQPSWEQLYDVVHGELGGPTLQQVAEKARAVVLAGLTPPDPRTRRERRAVIAQQKRLAKKARKAGAR